MRLIHTADWHLGRRLKGVDRTPEVADALERMLAYAKDQAVDAVLVAGDLFDMASPPAEAEKVAYRFFFELQRSGIPAVVIAGNHDSAFRLDGVANLLSLAGVHALGRPRRSAQGGVLTLDTRSGKLRVGALPFASERRLLTAEELWSLDAVEQRQQYREAVAYLMRDLASTFSGDAVNVLMAHVALEGARLAHSEATFYTTDAYMLSELALPAEAQYIALGHIHTPQAIQASSPTYYAGSLIQVDFGEAEEEKGFNVIDLEVGRPAQVKFVPLEARRPLKVVRCTMDDMGAVLSAAVSATPEGLFKVVVSLERPLLGLGDKVRALCPTALQIEPRYPQAPHGASEALDPRALSPLDSYRRFYAERLGTTPSLAVSAAFESLYEEMSRETA